MSDRRFVLALWFAGIATFSALYAPQGVLTVLADDAGVSEATSALVVSSATLGLASGVLPWAWISSRIGRVRSLRIAAMAAAVMSLIVPLMGWFEMMLVFRFLQGGALAGVPAIIIAVIFDYARGSQAQVLAGTYVAATTVGGLASRLVAGPFGALLGWQWGIGIVGGFCAALFAGFVWALKPLREQDIRSSRLFDVLRTHASDPQLRALWVIGGLLIGVVVGVYNYLPFRLELPPFNVPTSLLATIFLAYLSGTISARFSGLVLARWGTTRALTFGGVLMLVGLVVSILDSIVLVALGLVILTGGMFLCHAIAAGMVARRALVGTAEASAAYTVTYYVGSGLFGWLLGFGWQWVGWMGVVLGASMLTVIMLALVGRVRVAG